MRVLAAAGVLEIPVQKSWDGGGPGDINNEKIGGFSKKGAGSVNVCEELFLATAGIKPIRVS